MGSSFLSEDQDNRYIQNFYLCHRYIKINIIMKIAICFACVVAMATAESWMAAPYTLVKRAAEPHQTKCGNQKQQQRTNKQQNLWWKHRKLSPRCRCWLCWCLP